MTSRSRRLLVASGVMLLLLAAQVGYAVGGGTSGVDEPPRMAFLATGTNPADALAGGAVAAQFGAPLFTTRPDTLSTAAEAGIVARAPALVIVLGGPVAVAEEVIDQLADATGLAVRPGPASSGIVRVAGGDRYETAAAVAGLLAEYNPAYLRLADADFARAGTACSGNEVMRGVDADGQPVCRAADAATLGGLAPSDYVQAGERRVSPTEYQDGTNVTITRGTFGPTWEASDRGSGRIWFPFDVPTGYSAMELLDLEVCVRTGAALLQTAFLTIVDGADGHIWHSFSFDEDAAPQDGACTTHTPRNRAIVESRFVAKVDLVLSDAGTLELGAVTARVRPTNDAPVQGPVT